MTLSKTMPELSDDKPGTFLPHGTVRRFCTQKQLPTSFLLIFACGVGSIVTLIVGLVVAFFVKDKEQKIGAIGLSCSIMLFLWIVLGFSARARYYQVKFENHTALQGLSKENGVSGPNNMKQLIENREHFFKRKMEPTKNNFRQKLGFEKKTK